jgi:hypothetical protein|eukprot:COSAG01_NODE_5737_length_4067_cov_1380.006048_3_plen_81_part_00
MQYLAPGKRVFVTRSVVTHNVECPTFHNRVDPWGDTKKYPYCWVFGSFLHFTTWHSRMSAICCELKLEFTAQNYRYNIIL